MDCKCIIDMRTSTSYDTNVHEQICRLIITLFNKRKVLFGSITIKLISMKSARSIDCRHQSTLVGVQSITIHIEDK
ncbi:unnamed protein product [Rotaria socialis]|uniref:Uncharacterized protein n=1 Tax=Rotaria socialis TaxID=392032 RepID=A0A818RQZ9_9BILA|nr:unnamed protein product [Rotaria socialis]